MKTALPEVTMKNKTVLDPKTLNFDKAAKPKKSLRPARSLVAVRSLKPKTGVASFTNLKNESLNELN
jgi:hypothetical protein